MYNDQQGYFPATVYAVTLVMLIWRTAFIVVSSALRSVILKEATKRTRQLSMRHFAVVSEADY